MTSMLRSILKTSIAATATAAPQARYSRTILVLSHMRAATTALSNVLCSHPEVSGYGETHVTHNSGLAPARVLVNVALRKAYAPAAPYLLDKVLHNRLDEMAPAVLFSARAIFLVRHPGPTITSICALASRTGMADVAEPESAACYYRDRTQRLIALWDGFTPERRFGLSAESLLADADARVEELGRWLALTPPLTNSYVSHVATQTGGGGDPTRSATLNRIEKNEQPTSLAFPQGVGADLSEACLEVYKTLISRFESKG